MAKNDISDTPAEVEALPAADSAKNSRNPIARLLAHLLDDFVKIPGTTFRLGLDPIIGFLFPGIGDAVTATAGTAIIGEAMKKGVPKKVVLRMTSNLLINAAIGSIPFIGDAFSAWFKSNAQNYSLLKRHTDDPNREVVKPNRFLLLGLLVVTVSIVATVWFFTVWGLYEVYRLLEPYGLFSFGAPPTPEG
ncbi:MAG: DUF4112 domain-containing protein [Verrucomicrobiota bacterium]